MAITPTSDKEYTFTKNVSTAKKTYVNTGSGDTFSSITVIQSGALMTLIPAELNDLYDVLTDAKNHTP